MRPSERVVVIGAGVSGLTVGCLLARSGRDVTVLEQHTIPGGLLQRFARRGVAFETGLHYLGGAGPGGPLRRYLDHLGVTPHIDLEPFDPDGFDEILVPGRRVVLPQGRDRIVARLCAEFPSEADGIRTWFAHVEAIAEAHPWIGFTAPTLGPMTPLGFRGAAVAEQARRLVRDPALVAVLCAHCLLYGVGADVASMEAHALISTSYFHSVHGVRGGGAPLVNAFVSRLREAGGRLRVRTDVARILVEDRTVRGVETTDGEVLEADWVVSSAHPRETLRLLPTDEVPGRHVRKVLRLPESQAALLLHCVARGVDPRAPKRNRFAFRDVTAAGGPLPRWFGTGGDPDRIAVLPSPESRTVPGDTVFQVCVPIDVGDTPPPLDPEAWLAHKTGAAERLVPWVEECLPAWRGRIEVLNVSTPRAVTRYVRSLGGSCFGLANTVTASGHRKLSHHLGLRGLLLTGQSIGLPGVLGSIVSAYVTAAYLGGDPGRLYHEVRAAV